jgi:hypothetical protein
VGRVSLYPEFACDFLAPCCAPAGYQYNAALCQFTLGPLGAHSPDPNITFDSSSAVACLKALQAKPACDGGHIAACDAVHRGILQPGATCQEDSECAPSSDLKVECDVTDKVCTTTSKGKLGDPCDETCMTVEEEYGVCFTVFETKVYPVTPYAHVACDRAQGLFCQVWSNHCAVVKGAGESCTGWADCAVGMNCIVSGSTGTCQPRPTVGQPCPSGESVVQCAFDAYCASDQMCRGKKAAGQSCSTSDQCMGMCQSGLCVGSSWSEAGSDAFTGLFCGGQKL